MAVPESVPADKAVRDHKRIKTIHNTRKEKKAEGVTFDEFYF
jgi:hypothetical protein